MSAKIILCILDGLGITEEVNHNAFALARTPNFDRFWSSYASSLLEASGVAVGLPEGQMGNSEVGHMTIAAGRVIEQDLVRINRSIGDGSASLGLTSLIKYHQSNPSAKCHIIGLFSDGGVHSHIDHIIYLKTYLQAQSIPIELHLISDGRDTSDKSLTSHLSRVKSNEIATIVGRYYAMDRDNRLDRTAKALSVILDGHGKKFSDPREFIESQYQNGITDEFLEPGARLSYGGFSSSDTVLLCNFRADRVIQLVNGMLEKAHITMGLMSIPGISIPSLFSKPAIVNSLGEVLSKNGKTQLRIAETEKYAHVTFFFNCGKEESFPGEDRILIKSPEVATYDQKPAMSAYEITEQVVCHLGRYDFICVNYANADMVGHTANMAASLEACEVLDSCIGKIHKAMLEQQNEEMHMFITSDHGNIEKLFDQKIHKAHTNNPVPFIHLSTDKSSLSPGALSDIAPTILKLMGIKQPAEMTGKVLLLE